MGSLHSIIRQMILSAFRSAMMSSASPGHINRFMGVDTTGTLGEIGTEEEVRQAIIEVVSEVISDPEIAAELETLSDDKSTISNKKGGKAERKTVGFASKGVGILDNPGMLVAQGLRLMPHAALVAFAVMLVPFVFEYLTKPGGDMDLRLKIYLKDEFNAFLSRQTQKDTEMGVRQVIIQSKKGFTAANGVNNYNTLRGIREGGINKERLDRIGMIDHAKRFF